MDRNIAFISKLAEGGTYDFPIRPRGVPSWTLSAVGDICFVNRVADRVAQGNLDAMVGRTGDLIKADIAFGNLETPLTVKADRDPIVGVGIKGLPSHLDVIAPLGFNLLCLANNHIMDFGMDGMQDTITLLREREIAHVGAGLELAAARRPLLMEAQGAKVGLLAYAQPESNAATESTAGVAPLRSDLILDDLARLRKIVDVPIVSLHEGFEFSRVPRLEFKKKCHRFADVGARVILGHHPHVPHGIELYHDCLIFYSLGNFLFDMHYGHENEWTRKSFIVRLTFYGTEFARLEVHPIWLTLNSPDGRTDHELVVLEGQEKEHVLTHLKEISLDLLDDKRIEHLNRDFITRIFPGVLRRCYRLGQMGDEKEMEKWMTSVIYRDPYLKALRDFVKYQLEHESVADF